MSVDNGIGQSPLASLQCNDVRFDRIFGDQAIGKHPFALPDVVRKVDGLGLCRRVPQRIENEHVIGGGAINRCPLDSNRSRQILRDDQAAHRKLKVWA